MALSLPTPTSSPLRLVAKSVLCVGPCSSVVSGPGRPRLGALQALSVLWSRKYCKLKLVSGRLEGLRLSVARANLWGGMCSKLLGPLACLLEMWGLQEPLWCPRRGPRCWDCPWKPNPSRSSVLMDLDLLLLFPEGVAFPPRHRGLLELPKGAASFAFLSSHC